MTFIDANSLAWLICRPVHIVIDRIALFAIKRSLQNIVSADTSVVFTPRTFQIDYNVVRRIVLWLLSTLLMPRCKRVHSLHDKVFGLDNESAACIGERNLFFLSKDQRASLAYS